MLYIKITATLSLLRPFSICIFTYKVGLNFVAVKVMSEIRFLATEQTGEHDSAIYFIFIPNSKSPVHNFLIDSGLTKILIMNLRVVDRVNLTIMYVYHEAFA